MSSKSSRIENSLRMSFEIIRNPTRNNKDILNIKDALRFVVSSPILYWDLCIKRVSSQQSKGILNRFCAFVAAMTSISHNYYIVNYYIVNYYIVNYYIVNY
jgi:hypothetical protein